MRAERLVGVAEWVRPPRNPAVVRETVGRAAYDGAVVSDNPAAVRPGRLGAAHAAVVAAVGGDPTAVGLYVTGLVLLDARPTQLPISERLPARSHDALNRLPRVMPLSMRALLGGVLRLAGRLSRRLVTPGYLVVDDVVSEKPFARRPPWAAWTHPFTKKRKVHGCHVVLLSWTSDPTGAWRPLRLRATPPDFRHKLTAYVLPMTLAIAWLNGAGENRSGRLHVLGDPQLGD